MRHQQRGFPILFYLAFFALFLFSSASSWGQGAESSAGGVGSIVKANMVINALLKKDYLAATALFRDEKALLYTPNEEGTTPLALAIQNKDLFMLQYLLKRGVPLTSPYYGVPPLVLAMYSDSKECLEALLAAGADENISYRSLTLLQIAVVLKRFDFCQILLRHGVSIEETSDPQHLSPLFMALVGKSWDIVGLLVQVSDNLNPLDQHHQTPLDFLIFSESSDILQYLDLLRERKPEVLNFHAKNSPPPLFWAIDQQDTGAAEILLQQGADVNISYPPSRETPLIRAVKGEQEEMVSLLLQYGPNLKARDRHGRNALFYARNNEDILILLSQPKNP